MKKFEYTCVGGETGFYFLIGKEIVSFKIDGMGFSKIVTGTPLDKEVAYDINTGRITVNAPVNAGEYVSIIYKDVSSAVTIPSIPSLTLIGNVAYRPDGIRTEVAEVGPYVAAGNMFRAEVYSHAVIYTAVAGDTPSTVAAALAAAVNATTEAQWNSAGSAPPSGTAYFKPTASASANRITIVLNYANQFSFGAT